MDAESRIRRFVPIQRLSPALQDQAVMLAAMRVYGGGEVIYQQNASDDRVHYLLAGAIEFVWHDKVTRSLSASNRAALQALDAPGRKRYTLRSVDGATIASFRRSALDRLVEQSEQRSSPDEFEVTEIATQRSSDWMIRMLQSELFTNLPATSMQKIFARMEQIELPADEVVFEQNSVGEHYYVIEHGYCEVSRTIASGRGQIHLADLGPGTAFGEEALISNRPRNATISMLSNGRLMRLAKQDFIDLILREVLHPTTLSAALADIEDGAVWLDIRYPEDHAKRAFAGSENIPVNMLRLQSNRLRRDFRYIICGDDLDECAIAAYLLSERGFDARYLTVTIAQAALGNPDLIRVPSQGPAPATIVYLPGSTRAASSDDETVEHEAEPANPLENTITRIAGLYTHAEAQREMNNKIPLGDYADTANGQTLADIIDELAERHDDLAPAPPPLANFAAEVPPLPTARPAAMHDEINDGISAIFRDTETRVREHVESAIRQNSARTAAEYRRKVARMRELTNQEIAQRETALRRQLVEQYSDKEQLLRSYYKKLIALANNISRQKAQLQETKKQFEQKLKSADQLYRQVDEMRELLATQISYLDSQELEEMPRLSLSL